MKRLLAAVLTLVLAACGGRGTLPPLAQGPTAAAPSTHHGTGKAHAALTIRIPKRRHRAHYVSASTQSGQMGIEPALGCTTCSSAFAANFGLTANSPNCAESGYGLTCTIPLALNPGKYVGTMTLYDGPLSGGTPSGHILSSDQSIAMTISAGVSNLPTIALDGVPYGMNLTSLDVNSFVTYANGLFPGLIQIAAKTRSRMEFYATDPDGDVILGPGSPVFTIAPAGGFTFSQVGDNTYVLSAPAPFRGTVPMKVTISSPACSEAGNQCSAIDNYPIVAGVFAVAATSDGAGTIYIDRQNQQTAQKITQGVSAPGPLAFDSKGDLFVGNETSNTITEYTLPYTSGPALTIANGVSSPASLAFDASDNLYVANSNDIAIYHASNYAAAPSTIASSGATGLALDSTGKLWASFPMGVVRYPQPLISNATDNGFLVSSPSQLCIDGFDDVLMISGGQIVDIDLNGGTYAKGGGSSLTGVTAIGVFRVPLGHGNDIVAAGTASSFSFMQMNSSGLLAPSTSPAIQGATAMAFDQYGTLYAAQPSIGAVSSYNQYASVGGFFSASNATGIAAYP